MKRNVKRITSTILMVVVVFLIIPLSNAKAAELNFGVQTTLPSNQIDEKQTYFDLRVEPGDMQELSIRLTNDTDKEIIVVPTINSAITNTNGVIEYGRSDIEQDETLLYNMKDIATVPDEVVVPANGEATLIIKLEIPEEAFDGILAGGISLKEKESGTTESSSEQDGMAIENKYAYVVALVLSENDQAVQPSLELNKVEATQQNARNVIEANLQNTEPKYMSNLTVSTEIMQKNQTEVLYSHSQENIQMAPNSNFNFVTPLNGEKLKAGDYTLKMTASNEEDTWEWTEDFSISAEEAKEYNKKDVSIPKKDNSLYLYIGIGVVIVLVIIGLFWRQNQKKQARIQALEREVNEKKQQ